MPHSSLFPVMYLVYGAAGMACILVVLMVLVWLCVGGDPASPRKLGGQEFIWTLVPVVVLLTLTVVGEIPRGWKNALTGQARVDAHFSSK
jgi:hypothetical protein